MNYLVMAYNELMSMNLHKMIFHSIEASGKKVIKPKTKINDTSCDYFGIKIGRLLKLGYSCKIFATRSKVGAEMN